MTVLAEPCTGHVQRRIDLLYKTLAAIGMGRLPQDDSAEQQDRDRQYRCQSSPGPEGGSGYPEPGAPGQPREPQRREGKAKHAAPPASENHESRPTREWPLRKKARARSRPGPGLK